MDDDEQVPPFMARYPPADISPRDFETFVGDTLAGMPPEVTDIRVQVLDRVDGHDGTYELDATLRCRFGGLDLLVVVEAKAHTNPIKREVVQILNAKKESVAANKAVLFSTAPFQRGAISYAKAHGIALVHVTEGRFTFETRSSEATKPLTRQAARDLFDIPTFVGVHLEGVGDEGAIHSSVITGRPFAAAALIGLVR